MPVLQGSACHASLVTQVQPPEPSLGNGKERTTSNQDGGQKNAAGTVKEDIGFRKSAQQLLLVTYNGQEAL